MKPSELKSAQEKRPTEHTETEHAFGWDDIFLIMVYLLAVIGACDLIGWISHLIIKTIYPHV
jgi:hypothetical protein